MKTKLHKRGESVKLNFVGDDGQEGSVWVSYLQDEGTVVIRVDGDTTKGNIRVEDMTRRGSL